MCTEDIKSVAENTFRVMCCSWYYNTLNLKIPQCIGHLSFLIKCVLPETVGWGEMCGKRLVALQGESFLEIISLHNSFEKYTGSTVPEEKNWTF